MILVFQSNTHAKLILVSTHMLNYCTVIIILDRIGNVLHVLL